MNEPRMIEAVRLDDATGELVLLDQTRLPNETRFLRLRDLRDIWEAIAKLRVRGAPAIGIAAAYGVYLAVRDSAAPDWAGLAAGFRASKACLASSRPTAVNLFWALDRMERRLDALAGEAPEAVKRGLREEAEAIRAEDEAVCRAIGEHALTLLGRGWGLLTHCNAGTIATSRYGTALAPIYLGSERGYGFKVYADETRPLLQGARLTAWELQAAGIDVTLIWFKVYADETRPLLQGARLTAWELQAAGIDVTLICDNMASFVMQRGLVQAVLVGCDRVAANGDTANKIGTSGVAILARHYGIPFYVHAPLSTLDPACPGGPAIHIEERAPEEVTSLWYEKPMAPAGVQVLNPAFDVTDASLITAIISEKGIARPPYTDSLGAWFR